MFLKKLNLVNFKNCAETDLNFSDKINCFVGDNGEGKTNLLDAIYYLSFCKSYFNPMDTQNIRHGAEFFAIHGHYQKNEHQNDFVSCIQKRSHKKQFRINKKDYERLADHIGLFPLVMVSPVDADLINLGSDERRKYFDGVISQFDKLYLDDLINYNRAVQHRNALLKYFAERNTYRENDLEVWDEQLTGLGQRIYEKRAEFFLQFIPMFQNFFDVISQGKERVGVKYESQLASGDFRTQLRESLNRDLVLRYSTFGVHKDDMLFTISDYPIKKFGSQGQQKSFLLAMKLAQFEFTRLIKGYKPILLFDDIFDKLDEHRVAQLIRLVGQDSFGQVFITDTKSDRIVALFARSNIDHRIFRVVGGSVVVNDEEPR